MGILSAGLTMSEIERAIAYWEEFEREIDEMPHSEILEAQREPVKTVLKLCRAELEREKNPPLTWEELAAMIGKPIYIADLIDSSESNWAIVGKAYSKLGLEFITLYDTIEGDVGCQELYGETWLSYRYEPKGDAT